ncbi:hypothetical protein OIN60_22025 [Paenibacillus sp. P96]|uniref:Uncharacterized protein n=1 Tax=Paenibacillus zeirhizosphaerae TaxID=2987519 RepID=A0ABT9FXN3_9BACL|nr:DUF6809 family protein [Paenibacillus sp. P96]MDP4099399.1 hypothetical protein [Paenibacillus sp. P96]
MQSILESLYYGDLVPQEQRVSQSPEYRGLNEQITESLNHWKKKLAEEDFNELEALTDLYHQVQGIDMASSFTNGFKLGAALMIEVLSGMNPPVPQQGT